MNGIRWMPMIRWLKFPFRVHILHKTVQLSVHELRAGSACVWLKACPTVPPSPLEAEGEKKTFFNILPLSLPFISMTREQILLWSQRCFFVRWIFGISHFGRFAFRKKRERKKNNKKNLVCNSESLHFGFSNDRGVDHFLFPYKTGNHNTLLWEFCWNSNTAYNMHTLSVVQYNTSQWASE